jgi:hypothetical protein
METLTHAQKRAVERYGQSFNMKRLLAKIRAGEASYVAPGSVEDTLIFDVPARDQFNQDVVVRLVVSKSMDFVITAMDTPDMKHNKRVEQHYDRVRRKKERNKQFFKSFEGEEDFDVTPA